MQYVDLIRVPPHVILENGKGQICILFQDGSGKAFIFDEEQWPDEAMDLMSEHLEIWTLDGGSE